MTEDLRSVLVEHIKRESLIAEFDPVETDIILALVLDPDLDLDILKTSVSSLTTAFMEIPDDWSGTILQDYFEYCFVTRDRPREPETFFPLLNLLYGLPLTPITNELTDWIPVPDRKSHFYHRRSQLVMKRLLPDGWKYYCPCVRAAIPTGLFKDWIVSMVELPFTAKNFPLTVGISKVYYQLGESMETDSVKADDWLARQRLRCLVNTQKDIVATVTGVGGKKVGQAIDTLISEYCLGVVTSYDSETYYLVDIIESILNNTQPERPILDIITSECNTENPVVCRFIELIEETNV